MSDPSPLPTTNPAQVGAPLQDEERRAWIEGLEGQLVSAGASFSEQAFSIGCSAAAIPAALLLLLTFLLGNRSWIGLFIAGLFILLLALALVNIFALKARGGAVRRIYREKIWPQVQAYLAENQLSPDDFRQAVSQALPQDALLIQLISANSIAHPPSVDNALAKE